MIERMKAIKQHLISQVEGQMGNLKEIDAQELHYVIESIENLSEAIYYCSIAEAMEEEDEEGKEGKSKHSMMYYPRTMPMYHMPYPIEVYDPRNRERYMPGTMYAQNGGTSSGGSSNGGSGGSRNAQGDGGYDASSRGNNARGGGSRGYHDGMMPMEHYPMYTDGSYYNMMKDPREGRSGERRKMYMEGKVQGKDKTKQMQELEQYMHELTTDLTEMVQDASPEEKALLQQKISTLATKIK